MPCAASLTELPSSTASRALCNCATWRSRDDRARRRAGGARLAELDFELAGAPGEGGIDQAVERERRGVGDRRHDVFELHARLAAREQRELTNLMARREPIAAEQRNEGGARLR